MKTKNNWIGGSAHLIRNLSLSLIWVLISYKYVRLKYLEIEFLQSWFILAYATVLCLGPMKCKYLNVKRTPLDIARAERDVNAKLIETCRSLFQSSIAIWRETARPVSDHRWLMPEHSYRLICSMINIDSHYSISCYEGVRVRTSDGASSVMEQVSRRSMQSA